MRNKIFSLLVAICNLCGTMLPATAVSESGFTDVAADAWYAEAVAYCRENGLMSGTSERTFSPNTMTSRAMLVTILYRQAGSPSLENEDLGYPFSDVPGDSWYADGVYWARLEGVVSGYDGNRFGPNDPVTREQLATILWRDAGSPATESEQQPFADQAAIASYAVEAVAWARENGIVNGRDGNRFDPDGQATRAETATILYRYLTRGQENVEEPDTPPTSNTNILVSYFSQSGTTEGVAEQIAELTGGDLFELVPETPYPDNYGELSDIAGEELEADARPALSSHVENMEQYDVVYLGFPIWYGTTPMVIRTFLEEYDLTGLTIAPFSTSSSGGIETAVDVIRTLCPGSTVTDGLGITSATLDRAETLAAAWISDLDLSEEDSGQQTPPDEEEQPGDQAMPNLSISVGGQTFTATLQDNPTTRALLEQLPMTVTMGELNGNEKYFYMDESLPTNAQRPGQIHAGDLMLYGSDCLVLFYESFSSSYSYTTLGQITDPDGLASALGRGSVEVTFQAVS